MMLTPSQCRAARALIAWSQSDLCDAAKVGRATLANFEAEKSTPTNELYVISVRRLKMQV